MIMKSLITAILYFGQLDVDDLKEGLKKLLAYYPHLTGRMKEASGIIPTNDGVSFTVVDKPGWQLEDLDQRDDFTNINEMTTGIKPARLIKGLGAQALFSQYLYLLLRSKEEKNIIHVSKSYFGKGVTL